MDRRSRGTPTSCCPPPRRWSATTSRSASRDRFVRAMHQAIAPVGAGAQRRRHLADIADAAGLSATASPSSATRMAWLRHLYGRWRQACAAQGFEVPDFARFWDRGPCRDSARRPARPYTQFAEFRARPGGQPAQHALWQGRDLLGDHRALRLRGMPGPPRLAARRANGSAAKAARRFPLHLLSFQPFTRLHSQLDTGRVAPRTIAGTRADPDAPRRRRRARPRGWRGGAGLQRPRRLPRGLRLTDGLRRGVVAMATGAWWNPAVPGATDAPCLHGNPNVLTQDVGTSRLGQGPSAQSCLVADRALGRRACRRSPCTSAAAGRDRPVIGRRALVASAAAFAATPAHAQVSTLRPASRPPWRCR